MNIRRVSYHSLLAILLTNWVTCYATALELNQHDNMRLINDSLYALESDELGLTPVQVLQKFRKGQLRRNDANQVSYGFTEKSIWYVLPVSNDSKQSYSRLIRIDNAWLDELELFFFRGDELIAYTAVGDNQPFSSRQVATRMPTVSFDFASGDTTVLFRIRADDPVTIPVYLSDAASLNAYEKENHYFYGALYASMLMLLLYNVVLYLYIREVRYLFYSLYLAAFTSFNFTYTGHGFWLVWPDSIFIQQWLMPTLMFAYIFSGIVFTIEFLSARTYLPSLYAARKKLYASLILLALILIASGSRSLAIMVQLVILTFLSVWMLVIGFFALKSGNPLARFFIPAIVMGTGGATISSLTTWGIINYSQWSFRGIEIGIMLEMIMLSISLGFTYKVNQQARERAEADARIDPLTSLYNRRAFLDLVYPIWNLSQRSGQAVSMILLDLDWFKKINDEHGHAVGDNVLEQVAATLKNHLRKSDIALRWGGEEFLFFLPNTQAESAHKLAEKLRMSVAEISIPDIQKLTSSVGVASIPASAAKPEQLVSMADDALYSAKQAGRNRVVVFNPHQHKPIPK